MSKFDDTIAIITGASAGIGRGLSERLCRQYPRLVVIGLSRRLVSIDGVDNFVSVQCDIGKSTDVLAAFERIGYLYPKRKLSIVVNNAAHSKPLPFIEHDKLTTTATMTSMSLTEAAKVYESMLATNVLGATLVTRQAATMFDHNAGGTIVNVNSTAGHVLNGMPDFHFYSMTKHAMKTMSEALRMELQTIGSKVRMTQVSPGFVATDFFDSMSDDPTFRQKLNMATKAALSVDNVVDTIMYVVMAPPNCQFSEVHLRSTGQLS